MAHRARLARKVLSVPPDSKETGDTITESKARLVRRERRAWPARKEREARTVEPRAREV